MRWLLLVVLVSVCFAQDAQKPQETPEQELERLIGRHEKPQETIDQEVERILGRPFGRPGSAMRPLPNSAELTDCQANLKEWQTWGQVNYPIGQELHTENLKLIADNDELTVTNRKLQKEVDDQYSLIFVGFAGVGCGLAVVFMMARFLWRKWRLSAAGKQLCVLVLGASWATAAVFFAVNNPALSVHPINLAVTVVVYSLPAILFAGIAFWWFDKTKQQA